MNGAPDFAFLDLRSPVLRPVLDGVVVGAAGITLAPVPIAVPGGSGAVGAGALAGPAGIAVTPEGDVYLAEAERERVVRIAACETEPVALPCLELADPRGVALLPDRRWLLIADTGHRRVVVVALPGGGARAAWGEGVLVEPTDLAVDGDGRVYVADAGAGVVLRFDADGRLDPSFTSSAARRPTHVAIVDDDRLLVLDADGPRLLVLRRDGTPDAQATQEWDGALARLAPSAVAADRLGVYVGDPGTGRVLVFTLDGRLIGEAGWHGACSALTVDGRGRLHVAAGNHVSALEPGVVREGAFRLGPFAVRDRAAAWRRLQLLDATVPSGAHVRLFTWTTDDATATPPPPTGAAPWRAAPADALDCFIGGAPARYFWLGGRLQAGEGGAPVLGTLRVDYDGDGWLRHLPAVYSREPAARDLLDRALAALESSLDEEDRLIDDLPLLFDPATAPDDGVRGPWLEWLAGWLAFELESAAGHGDRRAALADAFAAQRLRGTAAGLRRVIALATGVDVEIAEPAEGTSVWVLGHQPTGLGFGTMLARAQPDGAVLATTATLDHAHLLAAEDYGAPLYDDLAHRFCVRVRAADVARPSARATLERIVDRERPAHTVAHLCVVGPRARVGFQATVGVDAIVAAAPPSAPDHGMTGSIGDTARVGTTARVG